MADFDIGDLIDCGRWKDVDEATFPIIQVEVFVKEGAILYFYLGSEGQRKTLTIHIPKGSDLVVHGESDEQSCTRKY